MKKLKLLAFFAIVSVVLSTGCKHDDYVATVGVCPVVESTNPENTALDVPVNQVITATFNENMNPETITQSSFTIQQGETVIAGLKAAMVTISGTISYTDSTASFTPASQLIPNTTYTGTINSSVKDMMGNSLQGDFVWTFKTDASPSVVSTSPATEASGVPLNKIITASFSVPMDPASITALTYTVSQGTSLLEGTVAFNGITASFTPASNLLPNTIYTGTITTGAKNETGTPLAANYVWTFTTGLLPTVTTSIPANNAIDVPLDITVTATFSMPMDMQTLTGTNVSLKHGTIAVEGTITSTETTVTFNPASDLLPGTLYTATITTGTENEAGISLASDYVWTFTTADVVVPTVLSTDPLNLATGVVLNKTVSATFSVPMDALTISSSTFTLKQGITIVPGAVSYSGSTASYNPTANLLPNTLYTATITTGAKNVAGTPLAVDVEWTFTTAATILVAPEVISTDPMDLATNVALNKTVEATFDVPMDALTISSLTFTLKQGITTVPGAVSYSGSTASYNPTANLLPNTLYTAMITTGTKNVAGTPLAVDVEWTFTTAATILVAPEVISTDPMDIATNVALNKTVKATFDVPMNSLSITTNSFSLMEGTNSVAGLVSYSGSTASFNPTSDLLPGKTYTATITTGAENVAGTPLENDYIWEFTTAEAIALEPIIDLKSALRFGILAGVGVSNNAGFSVINDLDVGIYPGSRSSVTGFPPATIVGGAIYAADDIAPPGTAAMLNQAKLDLVEAYLAAEGATAPAPATVEGDQGGKTLAPGIYKSTSTLLIQAGNLTLDGQGDPNATWIFQIASAFTTVGGAGGSIILTGGANAENIFWQTGSSAVIGDNTVFYGNVLALQSITMNSNATVVGRMLAQNGSVVMTNTNTITKP
ncbi:MAG TPA: Ig-like domain-containing protein [Prolixibacteraceae bacterium]|nr:Ig-like domain-containing protein [Prolixibacteraceae bacterium]